MGLIDFFPIKDVKRERMVNVINLHIVAEYLYSEKSKKQRFKEEDTKVG